MHPGGTIPEGVESHWLNDGRRMLRARPYASIPHFAGKWGDPPTAADLASEDRAVRVDVAALSRAAGTRLPPYDPPSDDVIHGITMTPDGYLALLRQERQGTA